MKRDKIVNNLTERLCSNAKSAVPIVDVFCLQAKLSPGRYNLYGNSLEFQVKYKIKKKYSAHQESIAARSIASFSAFGTQGGSSNTLSDAQLDNLFGCSASLLRKTGSTKITVFLSSQHSPNLLLCLRRRYHTRHSCGSGKGRPLWSSRPQRS